MVQDRPAYLRIADDLREQIRTGGYPPGSRLPTMAVLSAANGVSEIVIRQAIQLLRTEGLVETRRGGGTVVRVRPRVRRVAMDRYRVDTSQATTSQATTSQAATSQAATSQAATSQAATSQAATSAAGGAPPATSFTHDQRIGWSEYRLDRTYTRVRADPTLASLFDLEPGTRLLRRHFVFFARGEPQQISINYLPWALVAGTPVADPAREPWPGGTPAQLAFLGHPATRVEEAVAARMPTPEEADTLHMAAGIPVLTVTRRMFSGERVLEVCKDIVIPADRVVLDYAIDL